MKKNVNLRPGLIKKKSLLKLNEKGTLTQVMFFLSINIYMLG